METAEIRKEEIFPSPLSLFLKVWTEIRPPLSFIVIFSLLGRENYFRGGTLHLTFLVSAPNMYTETSDGILVPFTTRTCCPIIEVDTRRVTAILGYQWRGNQHGRSLAPRHSGQSGSLLFFKKSFSAQLRRSVL